MPAQLTIEKKELSVPAVLLQLLILVFILLFAVLQYTFLHESGHAAIGLLFGARLTSFSVDFIGMSAHVGLDASFSAQQQSAVSLAGPLLPLLAAVLLLGLAPRRANAVLEYLKLLVPIVAVNALLAWIVLPLVYLSGQMPGDDSITFLIHSGASPILVSIAAAAVYLAGWVLLLMRVEGPRGALARLRAQPAEYTTPAARRSLAVVLLFFALLAAAATTLGAVYGTQRTPGAPSGYSQVAVVALSESPRTAEPVYTFTLEQPVQVSLFFNIQGLDGGPAEISLVGPNGYSNLFFRWGVEAAGNATVHPRDLALEPGLYQVLFTFPQGQGVVSIARKIVP